MLFPSETFYEFRGTMLWAVALKSTLFLFARPRLAFRCDGRNLLCSGRMEPIFRLDERMLAANWLASALPLSRFEVF